MLNIYFGVQPEEIYNTSVYFKNVYEDEWIIDPFVKKMIKSVDKGEVINEKIIDTKALGTIDPTRLSGGVKTLILMNFIDDKIFNASNCGDNCAKWILKIAKKKDLTIDLHHIMEFGDGNFEARILNTNVVVHNMRELAENAVFLI